MQKSIVHWIIHIFEMAINNFLQKSMNKIVSYIIYVLHYSNTIYITNAIVLAYIVGETSMTNEIPIIQYNRKWAYRSAKYKCTYGASVKLLSSVRLSPDLNSPRQLMSWHHSSLPLVMSNSTLSLVEINMISAFILSKWLIQWQEQVHSDKYCTC